MFKREIFKKTQKRTLQSRFFSVSLRASKANRNLHDDSEQDDSEQDVTALIAGDLLPMKPIADNRSR